MNILSKIALYFIIIMIGFIILILTFWMPDGPPSKKTKWSIDCTRISMSYRDVLEKCGEPNQITFVNGLPQKIYYTHYDKSLYVTFNTKGKVDYISYSEDDKTYVLY